MRTWCAFAAGLSLSTVVGAQPGSVGVELNKLEPVEDTCRVYLLLENRGGEAFQSLKLDLVMFDQESIIARRLAVETAPLPGDKTLLKVFDLPQLPCTNLGRVLLNEVLACERDGGDVNGCLDLVQTSSRADVEFIK